MAMDGNILVVEDETLPRNNICRVLREEGYAVVAAANGGEAIEQIDETDFSLVVTDLKMPGVDGMAVVKHLRTVSPQTLVMIMTAYASVDTAVEALRLGAQDYILKPISFEDLLAKVNRLMEYRRLAWEIRMLRRQANDGADPTKLVGCSEAMQRISTLIRKVAPSDSTVLITGESGVGKEVVARAIHLQSPRKDKVFLPVNCSAIPETLLESQLFGYVRGAFTGANSSQDGLFQRARTGTIFLDEIGEIPRSIQAKLLRAIEEKEVLPVGSTKPVLVDIRIIAATNRSLKAEMEAGRFREDLYYRLDVINLHVPPLRERREDIPPLVEHLVSRHNREMKQAYKGVDNAAMKALMSLPWQGNIRELDNVLERAMILGDGEWISAEDFPWEPSENQSAAPKPGRNLKAAVEAYEKSHIENVLKETSGDRKRAAELLGLSRSSLYRKIGELGIRLHDAHAEPVG